MNRRLKSGLTIFAYFTATGLLFFGYRYLEVVANHETISPLAPLINELLTGSWMAALLFPFLARFARRFPLGRSNWLQRIPLHIGGLVVYSFAHTTLLWVSRNFLYPIFGLGRYDYGIMIARYPMEFSHDVLVYGVLVSMVYLFDHHVREAQLQGRLAQARLENLRLQLQPHFLFNSLNAISTMVYEDPRKADAMIAQLSNLLRATIEDSDTQEVPLDREIETLELYLNVMRQRFEDKLSVEVHIAPDVRKALVPHLLLQPLVENSIRHGADPLSNTIHVTVTAEREGLNTRLQVRDCGRGMSKGDVKRGTGLSNTEERLQQLYGAGHSLEFQNCDDGGLAVTVAVPYRT